MNRQLQQRQGMGYVSIDKNMDLELQVPVKNNSDNSDNYDILHHLQSRIYSFFESMIPTNVNNKQTVHTSLENVTKLVLDQFTSHFIDSWKKKQDFSKLGRIQHSKEQVYHDNVNVVWFLNGYWDFRSTKCDGDIFDLRLIIKPLSLKLVLLKDDVLHQINDQLKSPQKMQEMKRQLAQKIRDKSKDHR